MNPTYFGDSYDLVKRFFCAELTALGYVVLINPMFTGEWEGREREFLQFIGAAELKPDQVFPGPTALFFDPDTGVRERPGAEHVSLAQIADAARHHRLCFAFDQSFSRQRKPIEVMQEKIASLRRLGCHALYYNSHARFLFASRSREPLLQLQSHLISLHFPKSRLCWGKGNNK